MTKLITVIIDREISHCQHKSFQDSSTGGDASSSVLMSHSLVGGQIGIRLHKAVPLLQKILLLQIRSHHVHS